MDSQIEELVKKVIISAERLRAAKVRAMDAWEKHVDSSNARSKAFEALKSAEEELLNAIKGVTVTVE